MDVVPSLKFTAKLVCIQVLLKHRDELDSDRLSEYTTNLLETDCFTAVSEDILHRIIKYFPEELNNRLLKALLPAHVKELNLTSCHHVTLMGLVEILKKCSHLQKLNLCGCTQLMVSDIFTCIGLMGQPITTVSVEWNQNVTDDIVQSMIKFLPYLHTLDISCCNRVTDDVFLVEKEIQLRRETSKQPLTGELSQYKYKLLSVDISGCGGLSSVAVRHLTSLSGPYLRQVNISFTKIDSTALFSLAGYSFPAIIDFVLNGDEKLKKEEELKEYVAELKEIAAVYEMATEGGGEANEVQADWKDTDGQKQAADLFHDGTQGISGIFPTNSTTQNLVAERFSKLENAEGISELKTAEGISELDNGSSSNGTKYNEELEHVEVHGTEKLEHDSVDLDRFSQSETEVESHNEVVHKFAGLMLAESELCDSEKPDFQESEIPKEKELPASLEQCEIEESQIENDAKFNKNFNGQEFVDLSKPHSLENHFSSIVEAATVDNYVMTESDAIIGDSSYVYCDSFNQSELTPCPSAEVKEFNVYDNSSLIFTNDLNQTLVCDTVNSDAKPLVDNTSDIYDKKQSQGLLKSCLSCDPTAPLNVLKESVHDFRTRSDITEESLSEVENLSPKSQPVPVQSTCVAVESIPVENKDITVCTSPNIDADKNSDIEIENVNDLEYLECSESDDTKLLKVGICQNSDEVCEECQGIKEKIKASRSTESDLGESKDESFEKSLLDSCMNMEGDNLEISDILQTFEANSSRSEDNTSDEDFRAEVTDVDKYKDEFISTVSNKITDIEHSLDSIDKKLDAFKRVGEQTVQLYIPHLTSLNIESINFPSRLLGKLCLEKFFQVNKELRTFRINWKGLSEKLLKTILPSLSHLQEISVEECSWLQTGGVAALAKGCPSLKKVNLRGVVFIKDMAMVPYLFLSDLTSIDLAESEITDSTLIRLAKRCCDKLTELDLSWCEEITERGINEICDKCSRLEVLTLKKCPVSDVTLNLMAENCRLLQELTIESVEDATENIFSDAGISEIGHRLRNLKKLDISWNLSITDISIRVIMSQCVLLEEAYMKGLKQITGEAFLPIIADYPQWEKCQALLKFKKHERQYLQEAGEEQCSSDEYSPTSSLTGQDREYDALMIPHRSTSYASNLRVLDLEYSDLVEDERMMEIVSVCRGSLKVIDYYGQELEPRLFIKK